MASSAQVARAAYNTNRSAKNAAAAAEGAIPQGKAQPPPPPPGRRGKKGRRRDSSNEGSGEEDDDTDDEEKKKKKEADKAREKTETEVWEWVDDLLTGFAFIYSSTVTYGRQCGDCVRKTSYPIKERVLEGVDAVSHSINPTTEQRVGGGGAGAGIMAPQTFAHEEYDQ